MSISNHRKILEQKKGQRDILLKNLKKEKKVIRKAEKELDDIAEARALIQKVANDTQNELKYRISELSTLAMDAVFKDPYRLNIDFEIKREKTEAVITFQKEGADPIHPMGSGGGGPIDVASFALQISTWNIMSSKTRATIIMDEPFKHVSEDLQSKVSLMLKEVSKKLNIQFIVVSHEKNLIEHADNVIEVSIHDRVSKIKQKEAIDV